MGDIGQVRAETVSAPVLEASPKIEPNVSDGQVERLINPLFPPLPSYGPPTIVGRLRGLVLRTTSFAFTVAVFTTLVSSLVISAVPRIGRYVWRRVTLQSPAKERPFYAEERRRQQLRQQQNDEWKPASAAASAADLFPPTEGGPDKLICDIRYYARRVGLDVEEFKVETEDGFLLRLYHVYSPQSSHPKYPVLLMHGLLQSAGTFCCNDDDSLAFYLCKSGYDVWLGNNRCGFDPEHTEFKPHDPRMWSWNIQQMGTYDLPAFVARALQETGFEKLGLVCHSQGTTQTFIALAKEHRPELGEKISVFCALAPAVYAGSLIERAYFKFARLIPPEMFRLCFGIHAFIPLMMFFHRILPGRFYGAVGYEVFRILFDWSDERWDHGLRERMFIFSPVYISAESMRWWLGHECFAKHKCILSAEQEVAEAWFNDQVPPMALWIAGSDSLVDGRRLLARLEAGVEPHVSLVHARIIEEYEHLDVVWALDAVDKVGREVRDVIWKTCPVPGDVQIPVGCEER